MGPNNRCLKSRKKSEHSDEDIKNLDSSIFRVKCMQGSASLNGYQSVMLVRFLFLASYTSICSLSNFSLAL
jgi:hypothetical protein